MTFQKRLQRVMKQKAWRVTDLARHFGRPYTTVREWVLHGRDPGDKKVDRRLQAAEKR